MNNLIAIKKTTAVGYAAMSSTSMVASGTIVAVHPGLAADVDAVLIEGLGATDIGLPFSVPVQLTAVDLSTIRVKTHPDGVQCDVVFIGQSGRP